MDKTIQPNLTEEKETLFICLRAKALDSRQKKSILHDTKADEMLKSIDYDFDKMKDMALFDNDKTNVIRAKHFDDWTKEFIESDSSAVVVQLGCGLDTRITRINPPASVSWFDVDYPEVIELRKNFFQENARYKMIGSSITNSEWLKKIPADHPVIVILEGLLEYLTPNDVEKLFCRLIDYFPHGQIIFNTLSRPLIKLAAKELKKATGAIQKWGVEDAKDIECFSPKLKKIKELPIIQSVYVKQFILFRIFYRVIPPNSRRAYQLFRYKF